MPNRPPAGAPPASSDARSSRVGLSPDAIMEIAASYQSPHDGSIPCDSIVAFARDILREIDPSSMK